MKVIILAGGFGTRVEHLGNGKPKPLLEVGGVALLEWHIGYLLQQGIRDIRLSLYHKADQIIDFCERKWPGAIEFIVEPVPLGTGGALKFASRDLHESFVALHADDIIRGIDVHDFFSRGPNQMACIRVEDARGFGLVDIHEEHIAHFLEKPIEKVAGHINGGWYVLDPGIFDRFSQGSFMMEREVFPKLAHEGRLRAYIHKGYWCPAGTEEQLRRAEDDHLRGVTFYFG